jgi:hypothetical protein
MKVRLFLLSILPSLLIVSAISNSPRIHSQGKSDCTGNALAEDEQDLPERGQSKAGPPRRLRFLSGLKPLSACKVKGTLQTQEVRAAVADAIAFLRTLEPRDPFTISQGARKAALAPEFRN